MEDMKPVEQCSYEDTIIILYAYNEDIDRYEDIEKHLHRKREPPKWYQFLWKAKQKIKNILGVL